MAATGAVVGGVATGGVGAIVIGGLAAGGLGHIAGKRAVKNTKKELQKMEFESNAIKEENKNEEPTSEQNILL